MVQNKVVRLSRELTRFRTRFPVGQTHVSGRAVLDDPYYRWRYSDIGPIEPLRHFLIRGQAEFRSPNCFFETSYYVKIHEQECCEVDLDLRLTPVGHFLSCKSFTSPSPLLNIESGNDADGAKRGLYLSIVARERNADEYAATHFDVARYGKCFEEDLPFRYEDTSTRISTPLSSLSHYAIHGTEPRSLGNARNPSYFFDNLFVNHTATQGGKVPLGVTPLSWYLRRQEATAVASDFVPTHPSIPIQSICRILNSTKDAAQLERKLMKIVNRSFVASPSDAISRETTKARISVLSIHLNSALLNAISLGLLQIDSKLATQFEIVMLDNASKPEQFQTIYEYVAPGIDQVIRVDHRISFAEANNLMSEAAHGEYLLLLNSDAFVLPEAVLELAEHLDNNPGTVAVAPTLYFADGRIQEAGGAWFEDGSVVQFGKGTDRLPSPVSVPGGSSTSGVYRSASCLMVRSKTFQMVGGFSPHYDPAYFEDTDLCAKLSRHGAIDSLIDARCVHLEGATNSGSEVIDGREFVISANRATFSHRVKRLMQTESISIKHHVHSRKTRNQKQDFLLTTPYPLNIGGGEKYLLELARLLSGFGSVAIAFPTQYSQFRLSSICDELGIDRFDAELIDARTVRSLSPKIHVAMGNSAIPPIEGRGELSVYHCQFPFRQLDPPTSDELGRMSDYHFAVVNSTFTERNLHRANSYWRSKSVVIAPPATLDLELTTPLAMSVKARRENSKVVSIGRFFSEGHRKNQHLLVTAFAKLLVQVPDASLILIGGLSGDQSSLNYLNLVRRMSIGLPVDIMTNPSRLDIYDAFKKSSVYWHATGLDVSLDNPEGMEHFGISVIEACQAGLYPFAHNSGGPAEFLSEVSPLSLYSTLDDLVHRTAHLMRSRGNSGNNPDLVSFSQKFNRDSFDKRWSLLLRLRN